MHKMQQKKFEFKYVFFLRYKEVVKTVHNSTVFSTTAMVLSANIIAIRYQSLNFMQINYLRYVGE